MRSLYPSVLIAVLAAGCGEIHGKDCIEHVQRTLRVQTPADLPMQFQVERCRVDVDACLSLCALAMARAEIPEAPMQCTATFTDAEVELHVMYQIQTGGFNCPIEDIAAPTAAAGGAPK